MNRMILSAILMMAPVAASATTFDFAAIAKDRKATLGTESYWTDPVTLDGITVDVTGPVWLDGDMTARGWDSPASGLGSCNSTSGDCNASDWDGIRDAGETIGVMFSEVLGAMWTIRETTDGWRDVIDGRAAAPDHTLAEGCARVNGVDRTVTGGMLDTGEVSSSWTFEPCVEGGMDYYVSAVEVAPIPLPAAGWLMLAGLMGLGAAKRFKV